MNNIMFALPFELPFDVPFGLSDTAFVFIILGLSLILVLYIYFKSSKSIKKHKLFKKVRNLSKVISNNKKEYFEINLKKLKNIAKSNSKYKDIFDNMTERFNHIFEEDLLDVEYLLKDVNKKFQSSKYSKELKNKVNNLEKAVDTFSITISKLDEEFKGIFQAGDRLRVKCNDLKEKYRQCKDDVSKYSQSLSLCVDSINSYFTQIDEIFNEFDSYMGQALYEQAQVYLDKVESMIYNLYGNVDTIAGYCNSVCEIIPNELEKLKDKKNELEAKGFLVSFAHIDDFVLKAYSIIEELKKDFASLYFGDFEDVNKEIQSKISEAYEKLDKEVNAKESVENNYQEVEEKLTSIEYEFIKLQKQYNAAKEYYLIPTDIKNRFDKYIVNTANLSTLRREYESYTFVNAKNPASFMLDKLNKMESIANEIIQENKFFSSYFTSLKDFVEKSYYSSNDLSTQLCQALGKLRLNSCYRIYNNYKKDVDILLDDLNAINELLTKVPINIAYLKDSFTSLSNKVNDIKTNIYNDLNSYIMLNKSLVYANKLRIDYGNVDSILRQVEGLIEDGNYKLAQEKVNQVLDQYDRNTFSKFSSEN